MEVHSVLFNIELLSLHIFGTNDDTCSYSMVSARWTVHMVRL